jgi:hypothetical protein
MLARAPCALALLVAGCFVDLGLPVGSDSASTDPTTSTAAATTSTTTTGPGSTTALADTTTSTSAATSSTTQPETSAASTSATSTTTMPGCDRLGDACGGDTCCGCLTCENGTCVASDATCGACQACTATGACAPVEPGTACIVDSDTCSATVWGVDSKTCYASATAPGQCDAGGNCVGGTCDGQGDAIVSCISPLCVDATACVAGGEAAKVTGFCVEIGETGGCDTVCQNTIDGGVIKKRQCAAGGACQLLEEISCGAFKCDGQTACKKDCDAETDCAATASCVLGICMPN